jgi:hypothetical protein
MARSVIIYLIFVVSIVFSSACGKVTFIIEDVPENTPQGSKIYLAHSGNHFDFEDNRARFKNTNYDTYTLTLRNITGEFNYYFTRGSKSSTEGDLCGFSVEPKAHKIWFGHDTLRFTIESWRDLNPVNCQKVTLVIKEFPENTIPTLITATGSFNNWTIDRNYSLQRSPTKGIWFIDIPKVSNEKEIEFKLANGSIDNLETDKFGKEIPSRRLQFGQIDSVFISIEGWENIDESEKKTVFIVLEKLPEDTPKDAEIFISGDFNGWFPRDKAYQLKPNKNGVLQIPITLKDSIIEFKLTRGSWDTEEATSNGDPLFNRKLKMGTLDTLKLQVEAWKDLINQN